ncbi:MAG: LLM class flavin-dependent oxidoreductase [Candidatus Caldarchaeum sp.]
MRFEVGLCLRSGDLHPLDAVEIAVKAEAMGFSSFWMTEELSRASPPVLALAAAATSRIKIGTAIISIFARTPMNTAMTAATLQEISRNRFLLGLGVGGPDIVRKGHGLDMGNAVEKTAEYIQIVKKFLEGERVVFHGAHYHVDNIRIWIKNPLPTEIYLASLNPKMLTLAGKLADGIILNMFDPKASSYVKKWINKGLEESQNPSKPFSKYSFVLAAASKSPAAVAAMKRAAAFYMSSPAYRKILKKAGHELTVERFVETLEKEGREKAAQIIDLDLLEGVGFFADENIEEKLSQYRKAGIIPLVYPQPRIGNEKGDIVTIINTVAKNVA